MGGGGQHLEQQRRPRRRPAAHPHSSRYNEHDDGGLDLPPLVSSPINGAWQLRPLRPTTFHRICTLVHPRLSPDHPIYAGSAPVAPLIVFQYILSATDDGRLLFYSVERHEESASPSPSHEVGALAVSKQQALRKQQWAMIAPKHVVELSGSIVALTVGCLGTHQVLVVVVMTCEGDIHLIDVHEDEDIMPSVVNSFDTGSVGPSSICIQNHGQLVVSFRSGCLEAWQLSLREEENVPVWREATIKLLWRGAFETSILSVSTIDANAVSNPYLAVCIEKLPPRQGLGQPTSSSTLEVIDTSTMVDVWKTVDVSTKLPALHLGDFLVWPDEGMEVVDSSTDNALPRRHRGRASMGSDRLLADGGFFAVALSDGTVATLHANVDEKSVLSWGVQDDVNQSLLQYPAIGMGKVNLASGPHLACSLRGGTTYLLPIASQSDASTDVPVFLFPEKEDDEDDDEVLRYIQGFTAGNIKMKDVDVPVLVYAGEGGLLEVYVCELLYQENTLAQELLCLEEMQRNGTIDVLLGALQSMKEGDPLLKADEWMRAYTEVSSAGGEISASSIVNDTDKHKAIRSLALHLAKI